jgi:DNA-directed RNA polymerase subunit RPC12/RpoP
MPKYVCTECNRSYDDKQFETNGKDYCSRECVMKERRRVVAALEEKERAEATVKSRFNGWAHEGSGGCY